MVDEINEKLGKQKIKLTDSIAEYIIVQTERMPLVWRVGKAEIQEINFPL